MGAAGEQNEAGPNPTVLARGSWLGPSRRRQADARVTGGVRLLLKLPPVA